MLVLGIESSCDDLSMALVDQGKVLANATSSQIADHAPYGGVVPEIASRRHLECLEATLDLALTQAGVKISDVEGFAATHAPGLVGSLLVGLNFAKALAFAAQKPFVGVHHIEGHLWSPFLEATPKFPFLALIVSGGHSHLYLTKAFGEYEVLGHTVDDAAGEAFDKVAKMLGIPYPGGPQLDAMSEHGDARAFAFALPRVKGKPLHTSFSGLKTAAADYLQKFSSQKSDEKFQADMAASFQEAVVHALENMLRKAYELHPVTQIALAGGVACNRRLRAVLQNFGQEKDLDVVLPRPIFCTDNGAMIAYTGEQYLIRGRSSPWSINAEARKVLGA